MENLLFWLIVFAFLLIAIPMSLYYVTKEKQYPYSPAKETQHLPLSDSDKKKQKWLTIVIAILSIILLCCCWPLIMMPIGLFFCDSGPACDALYSEGNPFPLMDTLTFGPLWLHALIAVGIYIAILNFLLIGKKTKDTSANNSRQTKDSHQITPLLSAVLSGDLKLVQATLAEHPEQLNIAYAPNGNTPLHVAALNGHTEIMQFLLAQEGIDASRKNNDGKTAFDIAAKRGGTNFGN